MVFLSGLLIAAFAGAPQAGFEGALGGCVEEAYERPGIVCVTCSDIQGAGWEPCGPYDGTAYREMCAVEGPGPARRVLCPPFNPEASSSEWVYPEHVTPWPSLLALLGVVISMVGLAFAIRGRH